MSAPSLSWRVVAASMVLVGGLLPADAARVIPGRGWCNSAIGLPSAHCRTAAPRLRDKIPSRPIPSRPLTAAGRPRLRARRRRDLDQLLPATADAYRPELVAA
jgi:hypothetical protein